MSAVQPLSKPAAKPADVFNLTGRVETIETYQSGSGSTTFVHFIRMKASGQYDSAPLVVVNARRKLGMPETEVSVDCIVRSYIRKANGRRYVNTVVYEADA